MDPLEELIKKPLEKFLKETLVHRLKAQNLKVISKEICGAISEKSIETFLTENHTKESNNEFPKKSSPKIMKKS